MEIRILAKVKKIPKSKLAEIKADFEHDGISYVFTSKKIRKAVNELDGSIDCIDNDYTDEPAPYYAVIYFGNYDSNQLCFGDDYIEHDTEILFAKQSYDGERTDGTVIVDNSIDMYELYNAIESTDLAEYWLALYNILGKKFMGSPLATIENGNWLTKEQVLLREQEADLYFENNKIYTF